MEVNTGHLVKLHKDEELKERYERLPRALQAEATKALAGKESTVVDLKRRSRLSNWAKKKRKAKIAAASRRRNR